MSWFSFMTSVPGVRLSLQGRPAGWLPTAVLCAGELCRGRSAAAGLLCQDHPPRDPGTVHDPVALSHVRAAAVHHPQCSQWAISQYFHTAPCCCMRNACKTMFPMLPPRHYCFLVCEAVYISQNLPMHARGQAKRPLRQRQHSVALAL